MKRRDETATCMRPGPISRTVVVHPFAPTVLRKTIAAQCAGAYVLGTLVGGVFTAGYVGRSDHCVRERLATHELLGQYDVVEVLYARDAARAFDLECGLWHEHHDAGINLRNRLHPATPQQAALTCPYCEFARGYERLISESGSADPTVPRRGRRRVAHRSRTLSGATR
jgi:hypothetical protein